MPGFNVLTEQLASRAHTLDALTGELQGASAVLARAANAGADTDAHGAIADASLAWIDVVGQYGEATQALATAVALAAECYAATDNSVIPGG